MSKSRILTEQSPNWVEKVWRKNASQIYKLCCARSKDTEHAKDLFQEVALRFCRSATVLDHDKPIFPWFMTVIRNTNRDLHRKTRRMVRLTEVMEAGAKYSAGKMRKPSLPFCAQPAGRPDEASHRSREDGGGVFEHWRNPRRRGVPLLRHGQGDFLQAEGVGIQKNAREA